VDRFHETDQFWIYTRRPHPEERAIARVSKDSGLHGRRLLPSFETHRLRDAPQDEVRYDSNFGNTVLVCFFAMSLASLFGRNACFNAVSSFGCLSWRPAN
jgi:hypothetical protein